MCHDASRIFRSLLLRQLGDRLEAALRVPGKEKKKRPPPVGAAALLTARGSCYLAAGDAVVGVASVLLLGPPGIGAAPLFALFGEVLMPLSELAAPGAP